MIKYLRSQKGLSLIELLVVVAIIAIVAGIAVPSYYRLKPTIRINGAARQIVSDLMWAKMKAVSENNDYVITFGTTKSDLSNNTYSIYDDNDNDYIEVGTETGELVKTVVIPYDYEKVGYGFVPGMNNTSDPPDPLAVPVTFNSGGSTKPRWFRFRATGRPNIPGGIYLILDEDLENKRSDRMRAVTVSTAGRVKIWKYTGSGWE